MYKFLAVELCNYVLHVLVCTVYTRDTKWQV